MGKIDIPVWEKMNLTLEEASAMYHIGVNELREKTNEPGCSFVLFKGTHRLIKRRQFDDYLASINTW
ncbi:transposase [Ruminococcus sp. CLA-AA-H200]|uniref:Transposase n=1 Tax=Ruminococcus turbiniformis TaxID=2881258 RepID=A0ABS8FUB7_9FIRM|nr:excisionase [Ruminococcus turbiniformis]MCC2253568.1 transposase [Ruminococcus turbiniformis]